MPWCPVCDKVQHIYPNTTGDSVAVPTRSDRYNWHGDYIGYEEGESYKTTIRTIPTCPGCNTGFEFPAAKSKEEYFYAKKNVWMKQLQARMASLKKETNWGCIIGIGWVAAVISGFIIQYAMRNPDLAWTLALPIGVGVSVLLWKFFGLSKEEKESDEAEKESLRHRLEELQAMRFSETSYQRLRSEQW